MGIFIFLMVAVLYALGVVTVGLDVVRPYVYALMLVVSSAVLGVYARDMLRAALKPWAKLERSDHLLLGIGTTWMVAFITLFLGELNRAGVDVAAYMPLTALLSPFLIVGGIYHLTAPGIPTTVRVIVGFSLGLLLLVVIRTIAILT